MRMLAAVVATECGAPAKPLALVRLDAPRISARHCARKDQRAAHAYRHAADDAGARFSVVSFRCLCVKHPTQSDGNPTQTQSDAIRRNVAITTS